MHCYVVKRQSTMVGKGHVCDSQELSCKESSKLLLQASTQIYMAQVQSDIPQWKRLSLKNYSYFYLFIYLFCRLQPAICGCGVTKGCKFPTWRSTHIKHHNHVTKSYQRPGILRWNLSTISPEVKWIAYKSLKGRSQDFSKVGSHCVKVRVLTRLSCHFHHLL